MDLIGIVLVNLIVEEKDLGRKAKNDRRRIEGRNNKEDQEVSREAKGRDIHDPKEDCGLGREIGKLTRKVLVSEEEFEKTNSCRTRRKECQPE